MNNTYHPSHHTRTSFFPLSDMVYQFGYVKSSSDKNVFVTIDQNYEATIDKKVLRMREKSSRAKGLQHNSLKKINANGSLLLDFALGYAGCFCLTVCLYRWLLIAFRYVNNANTNRIELF